MSRPKGEPTRTFSIRAKTSTIEAAQEIHGRKLNSLICDYVEHLANGGIVVEPPAATKLPTPDAVRNFWAAAGFCSLAEVGEHFRISPEQAKELIRQHGETDRRERGTTYPTL
jgi:hypothetical protein